MKKSSQRNRPTAGSVKYRTPFQGNVASPLQLKEFHDFVGQFLNLWKNGCKATLHISCHGGQASVNLHVDLGHSLPSSQDHSQFHQPHLPPNHHKVSPSRLRRRQRRVKARNDGKVSPNITLSPSISISQLNKVEGQKESEEVAPTEAEKADSNIALNPEAGIVSTNVNFPPAVPSPQLLKDETKHEGKIAENMTELDPGALKVPHNVSFSHPVPLPQLKKVKTASGSQAAIKIAKRRFTPVNYKKMFYLT